MIARAQRDLKAVPGVQHVGTHIGQAFLADEVAGVNFGEDWIAVDPHADYEKTVAQIQAGRRQVPRARSTTCRPTSTSGSTRCSRGRAIRSSSASSATT